MRIGSSGINAINISGRQDRDFHLWSPWVGDAPRQARMFMAREALGNGRPARSEYRGPRYVLGFSNEKAG
jgi:hypothetical protein